MEIPCSGTGQDGDTLAGLPWPNPRFTNNGNGTITDNLTGLIWDQDAGMTVFNGWQAALEAVKNLNSAQYKGFSDWRLPNVNELASLLMNDPLGQRSDIWLASQGFTGVQDSTYSSSTTSAYFTEIPAA